MAVSDGTAMGADVAVAVKLGNMVAVSGSVGNGVEVSKVGMIVTPGVMVGTLGTHSSSPGKMNVSRLQFATWRAPTVVRYRVAIWNSVSPLWTV